MDNTVNLPPPDQELDPPNRERQLATRAVTLRQAKAKVATVRPEVYRGKLPQLTDRQKEHVSTKKNKITGVLLMIIGFAVLLFAVFKWMFWKTERHFGPPVDFFVILIAVGIILIICGVTYLVRMPINTRDTWPRNLPYK